MINYVRKQNVIVFRNSDSIQNSYKTELISIDFDGEPSLLNWKLVRISPYPSCRICWNYTNNAFESI